jgi:hypothetical protein
VATLIRTKELEYAALKQQFSHDRHQYVEHKKEFIDSMKLKLWAKYCAHDDKITD